MIMGKKSKNSKDNKLRTTPHWSAIAGVVSFMLLIILLLVSIFYFRMQIASSSALQDEVSYSNYDRYYVMITDDDSGSFWQSVYQGALKEATENNAYIEMISQTLSGDYSKYELLEIAIDAKADGIIVQGDNSAEMDEMLDKAADAGIPVVTVYDDNSDGYRQSFVGVSTYELGQSYGQQICEVIEQREQGYLNTGSYHVLVLVDEDTTSSGQSTILSTLKEVIQESEFAGRCEINTATIPDNAAFSAEEAIRDIFLHTEPIPDVVVCLNEKNTICTYQAVVDYNLVGTVDILGYYSSETILGAIEKQIIYSTVSIDTEQMGTYCVQALNEYIESGYVSEYYAVDSYLIDYSSVIEDSITEDLN